MKSIILFLSEYFLYGFILPLKNLFAKLLYPLNVVMVLSIDFTSGIIQIQTMFFHIITSHLLTYQHPSALFNNIKRIF